MIPQQRGRTLREQDISYQVGHGELTLDSETLDMLLQNVPYL